MVFVLRPKEKDIFFFIGKLDRARDFEGNTVFGPTDFAKRNSFRSWGKITFNDLLNIKSRVSIDGFATVSGFPVFGFYIMNFAVDDMSCALSKLAKGSHIEAGRK